MRESAKLREPLEMRVLSFIHHNRLVERNTKLVVAVSGGPDSVCLLRVLFELKDELGIELHIAHLNHMLRGPDSRADGEYVASLAKKLALPATIEERDVKTYRARRRISLEEAAREVRYGFLADVVSSRGAAGVAVGHTRDDNVETVLMHLIRGTGTRGMRGLQPVGRWKSGDKSVTVIRPLLAVTREETEKYCREHDLAPRTDESNRSLSLFRNRIRLELLPLLRKYNPGVNEALLRTAGTASDELAFLDQEAARLWNAVAEKREGTIVLKKQGMTELPPALKRHLLRMAVEELLGSLKDVETRHIEELLEGLEKPAGKTLSLPSGLFFAVEYDRYLLTRDPAELCPFPALDKEFALNMSGETMGSGWLVTATVSLVGEQPRVSPFRKGGSRGIWFPEVCLYDCFDFDRTGGQLTVRSYRPGDRFEPLGLGKTKKLGEFMLDARIPRLWRPRVPIVASPGQIIWVAGWRIDERVRVTESTKKVLCLEFRRV